MADMQIGWFEAQRVALHPEEYTAAQLRQAHAACLERAVHLLAGAYASDVVSIDGVKQVAQEYRNRAAVINTAWLLRKGCSTKITDTPPKSIRDIKEQSE